MQLEVAKHVEMPLLSRTRVTAWATFDTKTPARLDLRKQLSQKLSVDEQLIIVKHVYQRFGIGKAKIVAHVYKDAETLNKVEEQHVIKKHNPQSDVKQEAKPAEDKK